MKTRTHPGIARLIDKVREPFQVKGEPIPLWRESVDVCALADDERHLGHVVRAGRCWIAYDAMHLDASGTGFRIIGTFATIAAAQQAIQENAAISWAWAAAGSTVEPRADTGLHQLRAQVVR